MAVSTKHGACDYCVLVRVHSVRGLRWEEEGPPSPVVDVALDVPGEARDQVERTEADDSTTARSVQKIENK